MDFPPTDLRPRCVCKDSSFDPPVVSLILDPSHTAIPHIPSLVLRGFYRGGNPIHSTRDIFAPFF